jgi:hypothetical protein
MAIRGVPTTASPIEPGLTGGYSTAGGGSSIFGGRIGQIPMPNPSRDLSSVYPNLSGVNAASSAALSSKLNGQLSPETANLIQQHAAEFGAANGMPGFQPGSLFWNKSLRDIGSTSEQQQQQGLQDYAPLISAVSQTQTVNPSLQAEVNATNATNAAAPDPAAAGTYAQQMFDKYLAQLKGPAGGSGSSSGGGSQPWWWKPGGTFVVPGAAGGGRGDPSTGTWV